jgi:ABC-type polysaccharide/polyol phosphate export permease
MSEPYYTNAHQNQLRRVIPELIRSRELLMDLVWKDIRVRYRYASMGFLWAVLEPLFMMLVLTFVFSYLLDIRFGEGGPTFDATSILAGLVAWQFLSTSISSATRSLIDSRNLVTKVGFPREVIPLSTVGVACVNFAIGGMLLLILCTVLLDNFLHPAIVFVLPVFLIQLVMIVGLGLFLSAANASFRDVAYMTDAVLLFGFYASPIIYPVTMVRDTLAKYDPLLYKLYFLNPMAGLITAYREALFDKHFPNPAILAWPLAFSIIMLLLGGLLFRKSAPTLADRL